MSEKNYRLSKVIIAVLFLVVFSIAMYYNAINNRYDFSERMIYDKWTKSRSAGYSWE